MVERIRIDGALHERTVVHSGRLLLEIGFQHLHHWEKVRDRLPDGEIEKRLAAKAANR
jgi:hypothetical protein